MFVSSQRKDNQVVPAEVPGRGLPTINDGRGTLDDPKKRILSGLFEKDEQPSATEEEWNLLEEEESFGSKAQVTSGIREWTLIPHPLAVDEQ